MSVPTKFLVTIGGFFDGHCEVRWRRGKLWYRHDRVDGSQVSVVPSDSDWEAFWTAMDGLGVWNWEASYDDPEICDGTQWEVEIYFGDGSHHVRCTGSNRYPELFQQFLEAVEALVGQPFGREPDSGPPGCEA